MRMNPSSFYPALSTHVQDGLDQHGEFANLDGFMMCLAECQAKITAAIQAARVPAIDVDVCYRIHQAAGVCIKALTGFNMTPLNARPQAARPGPATPATHPPPTQPTAA